MNTAPDLDKTARHETIFHLCSSASLSTKFTTNFAKIFVLNEGRRTKTGYGFMFRCFVRIRPRVLARISKVAVQNNFVGMATIFCGRGHMFLGVAAFFCCCGIVVLYSLNLLTFSFRCTFPSVISKSTRMV